MSQLNEEIIRNITFNETFECFICCDKNYIRIFNISPVREIAEIDTSRFGTAFLCDVLARSNIVGFVTQEEQNVFQIYNDAPGKKSVKMRLKFGEIIFGIQIRRQWMAIVLRSETHVYKLHCDGGIFDKPTAVHVYKTYDNQRGICDITRCERSFQQIIISPSEVKGCVQIMNLIKVNHTYPTKIITAHNHAIGPIALNKSGRFIATSSVHGTLIRIWSSSNRDKLLEFRRGSDSATIYNINFDETTKYLCCSSDKGTVHVFSLVNTDNLSNSTMQMLKKLVDIQRSIDTFKTHTAAKVICAFISSNMIVALGFNGTFRRYHFQFIPNGNNKLILHEYEEFLQLCANP